MTPTPTTDAASSATSQCLPSVPPLPDETRQRIAYVHGIRAGTEEAKASGLNFGSANVYVVSKRAVVTVHRRGLASRDSVISPEEALRLHCDSIVAKIEARHAGDPFFRFHYPREAIVRNLISGEGVVVGDGSRTKAH